MPKKKNQHYVPQFYLRNFSLNNDQTTIGIYVKEVEHFFRGASISDQVSKDYFYGKNLAHENLLSRIESKTKPIISELIESNSLPENQSEQYLVLMSFICLMSLRTLTAVETVDEAWDKSLLQIFKHEKLIPEEAKINDNTAGTLVTTAIESTPLLMDLGIKLLKNKTIKPFITSDHPAVKYNQLFEKKDSLGGNVGLASRGLKIFLPITPSLQLVAFDKEIYQVGRSDKQVIELTEIKDIVALNSLQMINSKSVLYFNEEMNEPHLRYLKDKNQEFFIKDRANIDEFISKDGKSSLIRWHPEEIECNLSLSFIKLTKEGINFELDERTVYPRDLELAKKIRSQKQSLREGKIGIPKYIKVLLS